MSISSTEISDEALIGMARVDRGGLEDFWRVYDASYEDVSRDTAGLLADDPEFGPLMRSMSEEETEQQNRQSREKLGRAIQGGEWPEYLAYLRAQGSGYARMGISFAGWFRVIGLLRPFLTKLLLDDLGESPERLRSAIDAMSQFLDSAMSVIGAEYLSVKEEIIGEQQEAILELSTPVLKLSDDLLLLPVIGVVDSDRARQMTNQLLQEIRAHRARVVVIDITGVSAVDSMVANHLLQAAEAARLLGARAILTGLSAEVAQTIVRIGVDLSKVETAGNLQDGVERANRLSGAQPANA
jgi:rsbT co-antagonist protein RsbR